MSDKLIQSQIFSYYYTVYRPVYTEKLPCARFCVLLHPVCAQNKCLISNTGTHPDQCQFSQKCTDWFSYIRTYPELHI